MIGPDDIGERRQFGDRRQVNHMPTIALSIAAVLLLVVGAMSYRDSVRSTLEKEYADKEARLMQRMGYPVDSPAGQAPGMPEAGVTQQASGPGLGLPQSAGTPPNPQGAFGYGNEPVSEAGLQAETGLPSPADPEIARIQESLNQAREQGRLTEQRYNQIAGNADAMAREAAAINEGGIGPSTEITAELPDFLREAVENPPGGNPELQARLERMKSQVVASPSLAKVTSYDNDWGIVTFNAGAAQGVKRDQRFAVRRGSEILGWVKVDQVDADQSIAVLVTKNRESDTALKPDVGDDLIDFELF